MSRGHWSRRSFLKSVGGATALLSLGGCKTWSSGKRPNILFMMADDHAANAMGCYGSRLAPFAPTRNIDRLAQEGMRLDNCFCTNSICVPSRATIMTGQYSHTHGVYTLRDSLDPEAPNVAKLLQEAGYQTALIGKWHLKTQPTGFDYWTVLPGQGRYVNPQMNEMGTEKTYEGYCTDIITDLSLQWLDQRSEDKPFMLMTHFKNSHEPWYWADRYADLFKDVELPEPASLFEDKQHRSPGSETYGYTMDSMASRQERGKYRSGVPDRTGLSLEDRRRDAYQQFIKDYLRCIAGIDDNVGRILNALDETGLAENTVVIYTSDQGYFLGEHNYIDKRWMFEESMQMPFLIRYPREIAAGSVNSDLIINNDFAPLFLDYAGVPTPEFMQGRSFRSNLAGNMPSDWRDAVYYRYWMHTNRPAHYGIRTHNYKLIFFYGLPLGKTGTVEEPTLPGWELYDLESDPGELNNVYDDPAYADVVKDLKNRLFALKQQIGDTDDAYPGLMERRREVR
jgi:arylsulfatase A-like enzyme